MTNAVKQLRDRLAELDDLRSTSQLLQWDQQTKMPPRGGTARAEALATLEQITHEQFVSPETGRSLSSKAG